MAASEDIVKYYMDPRNFLDETNVFQFLTHTYDSNSHTVEGLQTMVKGSFLAGTAAGGGSSAPGGRSSQTEAAAVRAAVILPRMVPAFPAEGRGLIFQVTEGLLLVQEDLHLVPAAPVQSRAPLPARAVRRESARNRLTLPSHRTRRACSWNTARESV